MAKHSKKKQSFFEGQVFKRTLKIVLIIIVTASLLLNLFTFIMPVVKYYGNSMTPTLEDGQILIVNKMAKITSGDIIAFYNDDDILVIHRIIEVNKDNTYITKGDHNNAADEGYVKKENIEGKVMLKIPYLAYPTIMFKR